MQLPICSLNGWIGLGCISQITGKDCGCAAGRETQPIFLQHAETKLMKLCQILSWLILLTILTAACSARLPAGCPPDCVGQNLVNRDLDSANLSGARLMDADLSRADMVDADLRGADLSGARLVETNLESANLDNSTLVGADFSSPTWEIAQ
jgi:hypothetical protein